MRIIAAIFLGFCASLNAQTVAKDYPLKERLSIYKEIKLETDTNLLSDAEKKCLVHLIKAAQKADEVFWKQSYMEKSKALAGIKDPDLKKFMEINYGPWDRLNDDAPFLKGAGVKPVGVNFYPEGFDVSQVDEGVKFRVLSPYTVVKYARTREEMQELMKKDPRNMPPPMEKFPLKNGKEVEIADFSIEYQKECISIMEELEKAAAAIEKEDSTFAAYLKGRAQAVMTNDFIRSDAEWLALKSHLDIVIGPIENYEDKLAGAKTSFEAYVLVRDREWGAKLDRLIGYLPELQAGLPVDAPYKPSLADNSNTQVEVDANGDPIFNQGPNVIEIPGYPPLEKPSKPLSSLAVFDVVYYGGDCNAGSKTIAVNLPNDEVLQQYFGTRRSQLKNTMKAKFEQIVVPISEKLIVANQRKNIKFDAFFNNVMFHEVAHGLGVKNLVNQPEKTVREALGATYSAIEECKADVLGLYMVTKLYEKGELPGKLDDYYVTFVASVFRSVRFGASSAHGKANMITFNTLMKNGCVKKSNKGYEVDVNAMKLAIEKLASELLQLQGNGDLAGVQKMLADRGTVPADLKSDLQVLSTANIPVDLIFDQGINTLGLQRFDAK
jgi:hypothetical protein